jgi:glycosyltransferase involved in cell wall biosynthesis
MMTDERRDSGADAWADSGRKALPAAPDPAVSVVVPARDEAAYLPDCLDALATQRTDRACEVIVVDGDSDDATRQIARERGATVIEGDGEGIGRGRNRGADAAAGGWLLFVDADTVLAPEYVETMLAFAEREGLDAASARCRMAGLRSLPIQATINRLFPRLRRPILPGFNLLVRRAVYDATGGFPDVPNEDTAYSRRLAREYDSAYYPDVLVETSARRIAASGLTGTLYHYLKLDWARVRADY